MDIEDFHKQNYGTIREMITRFFGKISPETIDALGYKKEHRYRELYREHLKEVNGLTPLLSDLSDRKIKVAMATMSDKKIILILFWTI
jgi:beta-phosphoglucomutase-like phosphatase (HAD superfamily)